MCDQMEKLSKEELIQALETAEKNPKDLGGRIGKFSLIGLAGAGSAAIASTALASTVTTTVAAPVLGSTVLGGLLGARVLVTTALAAPTLPVVAWGVVGIVATQCLIKLVESGFNNDRKRKKFIGALKKKVLNYGSSVSEATDGDLKIAKLSGIYAELLKIGAIEAEDVEVIISGVANGSIDSGFAIENATLIMEDILSEPNKGGAS